jgi:hypothetical protein
MPKIEELHTYGETENAVAIMDCIGNWPLNNVQIQDALEGRKGVYDLAIGLGIALERVVSQKEDGWDQLDWYLTTEAIGTKLREIESKHDLPDDYEEFVKSCLRE